MRRVQSRATSKPEKMAGSSVLSSLGNDGSPSVGASGQRTDLVETPDSENSCDRHPNELPISSMLELPSVPEETEVDGSKKPPRDSVGSLVVEENIASSVDSSEELIIWQGSTAAKTFHCRGWSRSDGEWERRPDGRRRDNALVRCADDPKFRTRLCNHWDESLGTFCPMRKKGKCIFAHGPVELRVKEPKRHRWGKLVDKNGDNNNPKHSGGEDTYGAARSIESERKQEGKWNTNKVGGPKGKKAPSSAKKKSPSRPPVLSLVALCLLGLSWLTPITALSIPFIQVCQNKDCCKRWRQHTPLPEVLRDLLGKSVTIETTSCLSQCGKGPNVCVRNEMGVETQLHEIQNPTIAVALLEDVLEQKVPSKLLAASNVLEKAHKGTSECFVLGTYSTASFYRVASNCSPSVVRCYLKPKTTSREDPCCCRLATERKENLELLHSTF